MKQVRRFDNIDGSDWMTTPFQKTDEGFLKGRAIVTSCGVFTYLTQDGKSRRELRLPQEVFSKKTLDSLKLKPVTLDHPEELVTPENIAELQVGNLGENPSEMFYHETYEPFLINTDGMNVAVDMIITKDEAIQAIQNGKRGLSMGYTCDIELAKPGATWCGIEYDYIQRNIIYNHCAIVNEGRAGDNVKIRIDSADAILDTKVILSKGGNEMLKKINLDGIEFEAEESVIKAYQSEKKRADNLETEFSTFKESSAKTISQIEAERDTHKERADKAEEELKKALDSSRLDEAVNAKIELIKNAEKAGVELKKDMSDEDIKKSIILKVFPKANLDGKDSVYIDARYDASVESLIEETEAKNRETLNSPEVKTDSLDDIRNRMIENMKNNSRK